MSETLTIQIPTNSLAWKKPAAPAPKAVDGRAAGAAEASVPAQHLRIEIPPPEEHIQSLLTQCQKIIADEKEIAVKILAEKDKTERLALEVELIYLESLEEALQKEIQWLLISAKYCRPSSPVFSVISHENNVERHALDKELSEIQKIDKFLNKKDTFDPETHSLLAEANEERYKQLCKREKAWGRRPIVNCIYCETDCEWCSEECKRDAALWVKQLKND